MQILPALILAFVLSGCAAPAAPRASNAGAPAITSAASVDLHKFTLNITMPAGQPTALVVLNVTKDMWVRPYVSDPNGNGVTTGGPGVQDERYWILCLISRSHDISPGDEFHAFPFWLDRSMLSTARDYQPPSGAWSEGKPPYCGWGSEWDTLPSVSIRSDSPKGGTLAVFLARTSEQAFLSPSPVPAGAEFHVDLGIGTRPCIAHDNKTGDWATYCGANETRPAEPFVRGSTAVFAQFSSTYACNHCGFTSNDRRTLVGTLSSGILTVNRTMSASTGLGFYYAHALPIFSPTSPSGGAAKVTLAIKNHGVEIVASCTHPYQASTLVIAPVNPETTMRADFETSGGFIFYAASIDIPIDIPRMGWTIEPHAQGAAVYQGACVS